MPEGRFTLQFVLRGDEDAYPGVYFSRNVPTADESEATTIPVFGAPVEGIELTVPEHLLE